MTVNLFLLLGVLDARPMTPGVDPKSPVSTAGSTFPGDGRDVFFDPVRLRLAAREGYSPQISDQSLVARLKTEVADLSPKIAAILRNEAFIGRAGSRSVVVNNDPLKNQAEGSADEIKFIQNLLVKSGKLQAGSFTPGVYDGGTIEAVRAYQAEKNGHIPYLPVDSTVNSLTLYHLIKDVVGQDDVKNALSVNNTKLLLEKVDTEWMKGGAAIDKKLKEASVSPPTLNNLPAGNQETPAQDAATPPASVSLAAQLSDWDRLSDQDKTKWVQQALNMYVDDKYSGFRGTLRRWFTKNLKKVEVDGNFNDATKEILRDFLDNYKNAKLNNQTINLDLAQHLYDTIVRKRVEKDKTEFERSKQQSQSNAKVQEQLQAYQRDGKTIGQELGAAIIAGLKRTTTVINLNVQQPDTKDQSFNEALKSFQYNHMSTASGNYYEHYGELNPETVQRILQMAEQAGKNSEESAATYYSPG